MPTHHHSTSDLIRNGEHERAWQRHCGFLELSLPETMLIQRRLLEEQFAVAKSSQLWRAVFPNQIERLQVDNFRELVPLTDYSAYEPYLRDQRGDVLGAAVSFWARSSGRGGAPKWVPYTEQMREQLGESATGALLLATARGRGDVRLRPHDTLVTNLPPRPFISGWTQVTLGERFDLHFIPPQDESEQMGFQERNSRIFRQAMIEGMDSLGAITIVLVRMGEAFASGNVMQGPFQWEMLHPRLVWRFLRARTRARREGRRMLPRDLWSLKSVNCGGSDTSFYREVIKNYWGVYPYESYGCTEAGVIATQAWDCGDMTFVPHGAFYEFIPEVAWEAERLHGTPPTETRLLDQLEVGQRYEVVITNFKGGPFLRYRMHDLVEVTAPENRDLGIHLPQVRFAGRSGDFIDLSGFAGLIDERQLMTVMAEAGIAYTDWVITKEISGSEALLHLYLELHGDVTASANEMRQRIHTQLTVVNRDYADVESMLGYMPLRVTLLAAGTFGRYLKYQIDHGAELAHLKPSRIQPKNLVIELLLGMSGAAGT